MIIFITTYPCVIAIKHYLTFLRHINMLDLNTYSYSSDNSIPSGVSSSVCCLSHGVCVLPLCCDSILWVHLGRCSPWETFSCLAFANRPAKWAEPLLGLFRLFSRDQEFGWVSSGWGPSAYFPLCSSLFFPPLSILQGSDLTPAWVPFPQKANVIFPLNLGW